MDSELGKEVKSKYKFIKSKGSLIIVYRGHNYNNFKPVEQKYLFQSYSQL